MSEATDHQAALDGLDTEEAAGYWDARLRAPDCGDADRAAFRVWRDAAPENAAAFERAQSIIAGLDAVAKRPEIQSIREAALAVDVRTEKETRQFRMPRFAPQMIAAGVAFLVVTGATVLFALGPFNNNQPAAGRVVMDAAPFYATAVGERSTVTLRDGSTVVLNTDTRLRVDFSDNERLVTMLKGQAIFDVAKNPARPFVVSAGDKRITAIGTVFDVKFIESDFEVTLIEGLVEVAEQPDKNTDALSIARQAAQLRPGQQFATLAGATASDAPFVIRETDVERATFWREGRVFFEDMPLPQAVAEMNRYSPVKIIASDPRLAGLRINGTFRTGRQENFVDALELYFPLNAERRNQDRIVLKMSQ